VPAEDESDGEDEDNFRLDLVGLQAQEGGDLAEAVAAATAAAVATPPALETWKESTSAGMGSERQQQVAIEEQSTLPKAIGQGEERDMQQVVATISTLAVHLQRTKPDEWNELIQVVLQGLMLARGKTPSLATGNKGTAAREEPVETHAGGPGAIRVMQIPQAAESERL
jgi:hypothetical protein